MRRSEYSGMVETTAFKELVRQKRAFLIPTVVFVVLFFIMLPILSIFTDVLDGKVVGVISWAYLYAFAQFFLAWVVTFVYWRKADRWDELARRAREEASEREGSEGGSA
ncbi:MAG TPA: DUF485 domain-containing protein [Rubrobacteraceae bacterium]